MSECKVTHSMSDVRVVDGSDVQTKGLTAGYFLLALDREGQCLLPPLTLTGFPSLVA